jgi:hypothetical protein
MALLFPVVFPWNSPQQVNCCAAMEPETLPTGRTAGKLVSVQLEHFVSVPGTQTRRVGSEQASVELNRG